MSAEGKVARIVFRRLLRLSQKLDAKPIGKALLKAQPSKIFDRTSSQVIEPPFDSNVSGHLAQMLAQFNGGEYYAPTRSVAEAVRFQSHHGLSYSANPLDLGLGALKMLASAAAASDMLEEQTLPPGTEAVRQSIRLEACSRVGPGALLISHPMSCLFQPALYRTVVLLVQADSDCVVGVVINKPMGMLLGEAVTMPPMRERISPLLQTPLYEGGDVERLQVTVLHQNERARSAMPVGPGLFFSVDAVADAEAAMQGRVKCTAGYAGWHPSQLECELENNSWFLAQAADSTSLAELALMDKHVQLSADTHAADADADAGNANAGSTAAPSSINPDLETCADAGVHATYGASPNEDHGGSSFGFAATRSAEGMARDAVWAAALSQLGSEHEQLARLPADFTQLWPAAEDHYLSQIEALQQRLRRHREMRDKTAR
mmetsp:Transcript_50648/g.109873  ORF Transcript_50648/g.109873 Transcript_50648/m.109873 type:complete len:433 (+) Transcript_50648:26-1324(+)